LLVVPGSAVVYGGIDFPDGASSFADEVVSYDPTTGVSGHDNASMALGIPDYTDNTNYVSLGDQGTLVLKFTDNSLTTSGNNTSDLWVFEVGNEFESTDVYISKDGIKWIYVGYTINSTSGIDIDAYIGSEGVVLGEKYSYVKLVDRLPHESDSPSAGADIDAIGAISSELPDTTLRSEPFGAIYSRLSDKKSQAFLITALFACLIGLIYLFKRRKGK
jgi:hypothetical protein